MSTLDDILKKRDEVPENVARGRAVHAPQPVPPAATQRQTENVPPVPTSEPKQFSYAELFKQLNTNPQPSKEELEKERRREKQRAVISAIGDGLSALANMHYTKSDAVNLYDNGSSLSDRNRERYKALVDERKRRVDAYNAGLEKAVSIDYNNALKQAALKYQQEQDAQRQANWEKEFDLREKKIAADKEAAEKKAEVEQANKDREYNLRVAIADANKKLREAAQKSLDESRNTRSKAQVIQKTFGKVIPFNRDGEAPVNIYENVWKANMQQVYDAMLQDGIEPDAIIKYNMNSQKKEDFVKQHWNESPTAIALMRGLSRITPDGLLMDMSASEDDNQGSTSGLGWGNGSNNEETDW